MRNIEQDQERKLLDHRTGFYRNGLPPGHLKLKTRRICLVTSEFHGLFKNGGIGTANTGRGTRGRLRRDQRPKHLQCHEAAQPAPEQEVLYRCDLAQSAQNYRSLHARCPIVTSRRYCRKFHMSPAALCSVQGIEQAKLSVWADIPISRSLCPCEQCCELRAG
jgi:hypothetical protein